MCVRKPKTHTTSDQPSPIQDELAAISREQFEDYMSRYYPIEQDALAELESFEDNEARIARAGEAATMAWQASRGVTDRALSDAGINLDAQQSATRDRVQAQNQAASVAANMNSARRSEEDRDLRYGDMMFGRGRQFAGTALNTLGSAASLENGRIRQDVANLNQWERDKSARSGRILGAVAGAGFGAITGGWGGALTGAFGG